MIEEVWKDITGYENVYQVSSYGRIKSLARVVPHGEFSYQAVPEKIRKLSVAKAGYYLVRLHKNKEGKNHSVHRLFAEAFLPNPQGKPHVNHTDGNKINNALDNLEWDTHQENIEHGKSKHYKFINPAGEQVEIFNIRKFCRERNLSHGTMCDVNLGKRKSHKGWTKFTGEE